VYYAKRNIRCTISKSRTGGREMRRMKKVNLDRFKSSEKSRKRQEP
jgi:hypothetical protein